MIFTLLILPACDGSSVQRSKQGVRSEALAPAERSSPAAGTAQRITLTQGDVKRSVTLRTEPIVDGCSMEGAMKTLTSRHEYVRSCAVQYAKRKGHAPRGRVVLALSLKASGDVAQAAVTVDPVGDDEFSACLKEAVRVRFPNPLGKRCIVQAPFQFSGNEKKDPAP